MKKLILAVVLMLICMGRLFAQEPSVKIMLNDEERFRFEDNRLEFVNPLHNVLIGDSCGWNINGNESAVGNIFIGYQAGFSNTSGAKNVFIGDSSGYNNQGGNYNTFAGARSGRQNTEGHRNAFFGLVSGEKNTTGHRNSYFGAFAGVENDTGYYNCFFGHAAGYSNRGSCNTFIGKSSGYGNKGDSSVMIGFQAGQYETTSDKLYIANSGTTMPLIYGEFDNALLRINGTLDINNTYRFPSSDGNNGQVLQTDGNGAINWVTAHGDFSNGGEAVSDHRTLGNTDNYSLGFKTGDVVRLQLSNDGKIGIGTLSPSSNLEVVVDNGIASIKTTSFRSSEFGAGQFIGQASRGSKESPSALQTDDFLAAYVGRGYGSTGFSNRACGRFGIVAAENWTDDSQGTYLIFETTPAGSTNNLVERLRITSEGNVGIATTPTSALHIKGTNGHNQLRMEVPYTPGGTVDPNGNTGDIAWDDSYIYIKTSTGWKRAALGTW